MLNQTKFEGFKFLLVEDDALQNRLFAEILADLTDQSVVTVASALQALKEINSKRFDVMISDVRLPDQSGIELLKKARKVQPEMKPIMISGFADRDMVIQCYRNGASDFLIKPFSSDYLIERLETLLLENVGQMAVGVEAKEKEESNPSKITGNSPAIRRVRKIISQVAAVQVNVLITGETGTGKEVAAREIHNRSGALQRKCGFVPVNCGAIPDLLIDSELFGHEKGAFTGAGDRREGLVETACGGTLFLDEICELPLNSQTRLLRLLQEKCFRRVGGTREIPVDVRVIAATNRNMEHEVKEGRFREDLYFRLDVVRLHMPPLRDRLEDLPEIAAQILDKFSKETGSRFRRIDEQVKKALFSRHWPGNIRELENVLKRAATLGVESVLRRRDASVRGIDEHPRQVLDTDFYAFRRKHVDMFEKKYFQQLMQEAGGDVGKAAESISMPRTTLYRFLRRYHIRGFIEKR